MTIAWLIGLLVYAIVVVVLVYVVKLIVDYLGLPPPIGTIVMLILGLILLLALLHLLGIGIAPLRLSAVA